jgi:hypothetical protein
MPQGLVWSAHWNRPIRRLLAELRLPRGRRSGSEWPTLVRAFEGAFDPERTYENPKSGCPKIGGDGVCTAAQVQAPCTRRRLSGTTSVLTTWIPPTAPNWRSGDAGAHRIALRSRRGTNGRQYRRGGDCNVLRRARGRLAQSTLCPSAAARAAGGIPRDTMKHAGISGRCPPTLGYSSTRTLGYF